MPCTRTRLALLLVACLLPLTALAATETERVHKVVPLPPGGAVSVHTFSGTVRITGADVSDVTIDAVRRASRDRLDRIKLDIEVDGATVKIEANKRDGSWSLGQNNVVETDFEIQVPRAAEVRVESFSSPVRVIGVTGSQRIHTFSGTVELEEAAAPVKAETFSGSVRVQLAQAFTAPDLDLRTFSGEIDVVMPAASRAKLEFDTFSGDLTSDFPLTLQGKSRRHIQAELGGGGAQSVKLHTFSGDVSIRK